MHKTISRGNLIAAGAMSALLVLQAQAQQAPVNPAEPDTATTPTTLPTVNVTAGALDATTENSGSYTTGGVSIGKATRSLRETPQSVTVITRYRLDDQNLRTVDDALLNAPGIIAEYQSSTERKFYSRGFEIDQVQFDGVPTQRGNGFSTSYDLAAYDRVEILRGPAGLFNGAGDPGGTINLVRKRPARDAQFQAAASVGRCPRCARTTTRPRAPASAPSTRPPAPA